MSYHENTLYTWKVSVEKEYNRLLKFKIKPMIKKM